MSFLRTLLLALVAAGLGAYLYLVEMPAMDQEAKGDVLVDVDPASVGKLRLEYPDGSAIEVVREGDDWKMTEPVAYPAEKGSVESFLTTVQETKIERRLAKDEVEALSTYGLEGETGTQARLELETTDGKELPAIVLGIATPVGYQAFARREGSDEVFVIPLLLQSSAVKKPEELRKKTMFAADSTGVRHVVIDKPGEKIELEKRGEATWAMLSPIRDAADTESVRSMLDSMTTIDAIAFFDGPQVDRAAFGLDDGATRFLAEREDGAATEFRIGKEAKDAPAGFYFERASDGQVVKVPDWVGTKFAPPAAELREKRLLACKVDEIRSLTWTFAGETFTISREAAGKPWTISPERPDEVLNQRIVDNAVSGLALARADEVVGDATTDAELAKWGLDSPVARLAVEGANGPCASLSAAPAPEPPAAEGAPKRAPARKYYVKNEGRSAVMLASEHEYSRLAMKRPAFVEAAQKAAAPATGEAAPTGN